MAAMAGRDDFVSYCILRRPDWKPSWHHEVIGSKLQQIEKGEIKRIMFFLPPRYGKTEECSIAFPEWFIGRNPNKEIIQTSYGADLAAEFGRRVRNNIDGPIFKGIFPEVELSEDSAAKNLWNTKQGGAYVAAGVGGAITGRGADLLIIDDPIKNQEEANSEVYRNKVWDWYTSTAYTRLHPGGSIILILTRWHDDDLAGRILAQEPEKWEVVEFPAIAEKDEKYRRKGEALWPDRYPLSELLEIKKSVGPYVWSSLFQQQPVTDELREFKKAWFKYFRDDQLPGNLRMFTTVDPAISKKESADYSCVMTVGVGPDNSKYIVDYTNKRMDPSELIQEIFRHVELYEPLQVGIETVAYQEALSHFVKLEMRKRNKFFKVEEIKSRTDKESKIRGLIPHYSNGSVYHRAGMCSELEDQLLSFPRGIHDDILDATAMGLELWNAPNLRIPPLFKNNGKRISDLMKEDGLIGSR